MAKPQALRTADLIKGFGVTGLTLLTWRKGTATKAPLPVQVDSTPGGRNTVSFSESKVKAWAKKHGLEFKLGAAAEPKKSGPVARKAPPPAKKAKAKG